jgi:hypothetical protein
MRITAYCNPLLKGPRMKGKAGRGDTHAGLAFISKHLLRYSIRKHLLRYSIRRVYWLQVVLEAADILYEYQTLRGDTD